MNAVTQIEAAAMQSVSTPNLPAVTNTATALLSMAIEKGASLEHLERLMALQERFEANEARKAFVIAMSQFKSEPIEILKRKFSSHNSYYHAELSDVTDAIAPVMARYQLSHRWDISQTAGEIAVQCIITHAMGHSESIRLAAPPDATGNKNKIQQIASTLTYLERYTLLAITGLSAKGMDDDGTGAYQDSQRPEKMHPKSSPAPKENAKSYSDHSQSPYTKEKFESLLPKWIEYVSSGKGDVDHLISFVKSRNVITEHQEAAIREACRAELTS